MIEITTIDNRTRIKTNDLEIFVEGGFEIKREGAKAPIINVISNQQ